MQSSPKTHTTIPATPNPSAQPSDAIFISTAIIVLPIMLMVTVLSYRRYRAMITRQRIQRLNRIWQLDCSTELS